MNNKVSDICRQLASNFAVLAEELDKQQEENEAKMRAIEFEVQTNQSALKDAANAILARFN